MSGDHFDPATSPLLTDLYQLTMLQGYIGRSMTDKAVFEFFVRRLPEQRNFLVAAGLEQALNYLSNLRFSSEDIAVLRETGLFRDDLLDYLADFRFRGDVDAMPEGTVFFANEPILRVTASLPEAQLVESRLVNILHFQSLIASKAARCALAAPDKQLVDFGMRRAHGAEAAVFAARAAYLAGFHGTSNVLAQPMFGIPIFGTMAHSFVQAHETEIEAFEHFARSHPGPVTLLIDTYDTEEGARRVVKLADALGTDDGRIRGVRLDSGDPADLSFKVRKILDDGGHEDIRIFVSSSMDEYTLADLENVRAPIDGFGIGTHLDVSADVPSLDCVYKIQAYAGRARRKRSTGKKTYPGAKQVYRQLNDEGRFCEDTLTIVGDEQPGAALLGPVMRNGERVPNLPDLASAREHAREELERLGPTLRSLETRADYPLRIAPTLEALIREVDAQFL